MRKVDLGEPSAIIRDVAGFARLEYNEVIVQSSPQSLM
jgi:hypothetical protein